MLFLFAVTSHPRECAGSVETINVFSPLSLRERAIAEEDVVLPTPRNELPILAQSEYIAPIG